VRRSGANLAKIQGVLGYGLKFVTKVPEAQDLPCLKVRKRAARHGQPLGSKDIADYLGTLARSMPRASATPLP
jgi:hypothetical protein